MSIRLRYWSETMREGDFLAIADWFCTIFFVSGLVIVVASGIAAGIDVKAGVGVRVAVLSLAIAGACTSAGWLVGLLFGIPRSFSRAQSNSILASIPSREPDGHRGRRPTRVNTNLEDISDWLTKTMVGVGLTGFYAFPGFLWHAADLVNRSGFGWSPYGQSLALMLFVYFTAGGFWLGYVGTRTILTKLLDVFDSDTTDATEVLRGATNAVLTHLYEPPPDGYEKAITLGEEFLKDPKRQDDAFLRAWLACAYGQKYSRNRDKGADAGELQQIKACVIREAKAAITADPKMKKLLWSFWQADEEDLESDLAGIDHADPELMRLLGD